MKAKAIFKDGKWFAVCQDEKNQILTEKKIIQTKDIPIHPANLLLKKGQPYYNKAGERRIWVEDNFDQSECTRLKDGQEIEGGLQRIPAPFWKGRECVVLSGEGKGKRGKITEMTSDTIKLDTFPDHLFKDSELKCLDTLEVFVIAVTDVELADKALLPNSYRTLYEEPVYRGAGEHDVKELENIIFKYHQYCRQQEAIKLNLKIMLQQ